MNKKLIFSNIFLGSVAIGGTATAIAMIATPEITSYSAVSEINFSTKVGSENLVEVFSDGFDFEFQKDIIAKDDAFKDFYMFQNFYTQGYPTWIGKASEFGGFKDYNNFEIRSRNMELSGKKAIFENDELINSVNKHLNTNFNDFSSRDIVGLYDLSSRYDSDDKDNVNHVKTMMPNVGVTSWVGARDTVAGKWGLTTNTVDKNNFDFVSKVGKIDNSNKGARVLIQDMTTHFPHTSDEDGKFSVISDTSSTQKAVSNSLKDFIHNLKNLKDSMGDVYDNSMIIVWGDHSDHSRNENTTQEKILRSHSNLLIKYPHSSKDQITIVKDRLVYGPQINSIISDYFKNKSSNPFEYFLNQKFDVNRKMYSMIDQQFYVPTIYDGNKLVEDTSRQWISYKHDFDYLKQNSQFLFNELMGGVDE